MLNNLKALVIVLTLSLLVFHFGKPICLRFMREEDFNTRRTVWIGLTIAVFASPSFWLYVAVAIPLLLWGSRKESNPLALYLLALYAAPNVSFYIPVVGINQLFDLNNRRLLAFCILIPLLLRARQTADPRNPDRMAAADFFVVAYCLLQVVLHAPYESVTSIGRRAFLLYLDLVLPYYVFSRAFKSADSLRDGLATFVLACALLAPVGMFESLKGWLLYVGAGDRWGAVQEFAWLMRAGALRAQASTGHSLTLGFLCAFGFGYWLYLARSQVSKLYVIAVGLWMWVGLMAAYSRGPWIIAVLFMFTYFLLMPSGVSRVIKTSLGFAAVGMLLMLTPMGDRIIAALPFVGTVDAENVSYRMLLLETSIRLIQEKPWFGDLFVTNKMEHLRQGQGIIDIVNGYLVAALFYGLVGLSFVVGFLVSSTFRAYMGSRRARPVDQELSLLGSSLVAAMLCSMVYIAMAGFEPVMWLFAGMCVSYSRVVARQMAPSRVRAPVQSSLTAAR